MTAAKKEDKAELKLLDAVFHDTNQVVPVEILSAEEDKDGTMEITGTIDNGATAVEGKVASKHGAVPKKGEQWSFMAVTLDRITDKKGQPTDVLVTPPVGEKNL